jgi:hypothetical protein
VNSELQQLFKHSLEQLAVYGEPINQVLEVDIDGVEARNAQKGETYQLGFDVTREMFDFVEGLWAPPTAAEMLAYNGIRTSGT